MFIATTHQLKVPPQTTLSLSPADANGRQALALENPFVRVTIATLVQLIEATGGPNAIATATSKVASMNVVIETEVAFKRCGKLRPRSGDYVVWANRVVSAVARYCSLRAPATGDADDHATPRSAVPGSPFAYYRRRTVRVCRGHAPTRT